MRSPRLIFALISFLLSGCPENQETTPSETQTHSTQGENTEAGANSRHPDAHHDSPPSPVRFSDVTSLSGVGFVHVSGDNPQKPFPAANGSGIAAFDFDLDGWKDLLFLCGTDIPVSADATGPRDRFYRNRGGWSFAEITSNSALGSIGYSAGVAAGDFNGDGFPDVYLNCFGRNRFYLNQGDGTFLEAAAAAGVDDPAWGTSAAGLDFDRDGDLDLYVCNYAEWTWETNEFCGNREKNVRIFCSPRSVKPMPDRLYENLGDGRFRDVLQEAGLNREPGRGQGVIAADFDRDGWIDLYVGNDINSNFLFRNAGNGRFEDLTDLSGAGVDYSGSPQAGMGVDVADVDRDGNVEIFVTNYEGEHNAIYRNLGNNLFQDVSQSEGMAAPSMRWIGWGTSFTDFDRDGWCDLVITNGHTDNNLHELGRDADYEQPPLLFHNEGGRLILERALADDSYFAGKHPGRALCAADLDGDLAADLVIGHQDQAPALLKNVSDFDSSRIVLALNLIGMESNRDAVGTLLRVLHSQPEVWMQVKSGGSYLSSPAREVILSIEPEAENELEIRWPSGHTEMLKTPRSGGHFTLVEGQGFISR